MKGLEKLNEEIMTENDILYFKILNQLGYIQEPFLEIGSAKVQGSTASNLCDLARQSSIQTTVGVDLMPGDGVDLTFDFSIPTDEFKSTWDHGTYSSVAIFNVLEHTFDPLTVLQNALHCVSKGGTLCVVAPAVWSLHDFPGDYNRLLPHWYEEFAHRFGLNLNKDTFCWLSEFGIAKVSELERNGQYQLPMFLNLGRSQSPVRYWISRLTHRLFNTYGRSHSFTNAAIGVSFSIPG